MNIPHLNNKEESKESYDVVSDKLKKRDIKLLNKGSFEEQLLSEFRRFADGMLSKMNEQNKLLREILSFMNKRRQMYSRLHRFCSQKCRNLIIFENTVILRAISRLNYLLILDKSWFAIIILTRFWSKSWLL